MTSEDLEEIMRSTRTSETCDESAGFFRLEDWVVIYGSYSERDAEFEKPLNWMADAVVWYLGLPEPSRFHEATYWAVVIETYGCADWVLCEIKRYWDKTLEIYDEWLALGCDDDDDPYGLP